MTPSERIIALANGEPVGEACLEGRCATHLHHFPGPCVCDKCHGTGRIDTEPRDEAERAVATIRSALVDAMEKLGECTRERLRLDAALEAERAAHEAEHVSYLEEREAHEETKRQLAEAQRTQDTLGICKEHGVVCSAHYRNLETTLKAVERDVEHWKQARQSALQGGDTLRRQRDQALREKAEAEALIVDEHHRHGVTLANLGDMEQRLATSELAREQMREALQRVRPPSDRDCRCRYLGDGDSLTCEAHSLYEQAQKALATPSPEGIMEKVRALADAARYCTEGYQPSNDSLGKDVLRKALAALYAAWPGVKGA